jgi:polyisoprenyl-phosphate glycosyltransferase
MKSFDIICPIFNEENTVPLFFERCKTVIDRIKDRYSCRLIFVDNSSTDRTHAIVKDLISKYPFVSLIVMSRNFGYQCSVECGMRNSDADLTAVVDVDCEDPPELFIPFLGHIEEGYDIVYGERVDRHEWAVMKAGRKLFYRLTRAVADDRFILYMAEFCVINRNVRQAILADNNSFPFIRASIGRVGFDIKNVPFKREKRIAGKTHYNFWRMFVFAVAGILSSSTLWLRVPAYVLPFLCLVSVGLFTAYYVTAEVFFYNLMIATGLVFQAFAITGMSLYLARIYRNTLLRPNYIINPKKSIMPAGTT